jgi:hypothetical protein
MRISVVGWQTSAEDVDRSVDTILAAARDEARSPSAITDAGSCAQLTACPTR